MIKGCTVQKRTELAETAGSAYVSAIDPRTSLWRRGPRLIFLDVRGNAQAAAFLLRSSNLLPTSIQHFTTASIHHQCVSEPVSSLKTSLSPCFAESFQGFRHQPKPTRTSSRVTLTCRVELRISGRHSKLMFFTPSSWPRSPSLRSSFCPKTEDVSANPSCCLFVPSWVQWNTAELCVLPVRARLLHHKSAHVSTVRDVRAKFLQACAELTDLQFLSSPDRISSWHQLETCRKLS